MSQFASSSTSNSNTLDQIKCKAKFHYARTHSCLHNSTSWVKHQKKEQCVASLCVPLCHSATEAAQRFTTQLMFFLTGLVKGKALLDRVYLVLSLAGCSQ